MGAVDARCKAEITRRLKRYKRAPSLSALRRRLCHFCGGDDAVEANLTDMIRNDGTLRVASGLFYLRLEPDSLAALLESLDVPAKPWCEP